MSVTRAIAVSFWADMLREKSSSCAVTTELLDKCTIQEQIPTLKRAQNASPIVDGATPPKAPSRKFSLSRQFGMPLA
jgi:hypothetical protein